MSETKFISDKILSDWEPDIRTLRGFVTVAEERNITRAANRLHIAQPALSRKIANLERELNLALFDRSVRGVDLTPAGKILLDRAYAIFGQLAQTFHDVTASSEKPAGTVVVGMPPTPGEFMPDDAGAVQHVGVAIRPPGVAQPVRSGPGQDAKRLEVLDRRNRRKGGRGGDDVDAVFAQLLLQRSHIGPIQSAQTKRMADRDLALHAKGFGAGDDLFGRKEAHRVAFMQVDINRFAVLFRQIKDRIQMALGVAFDPAGIKPADNLDAHRQSRIH